MTDLTNLNAYDYELPARLIAQEPAPVRDAARLFVIDRQSEHWTHAHVRDLPSYLQSGDQLVLNDSRVVPARLVGFRTATGGHWEGLYLGRLPEGDWKLIGQTRGRLQAGETVTIPTASNPTDVLTVRLKERLEGGLWRAIPESDRDTFDLLEHFGSVPLPPYIHSGDEQPGDRERYQTVYASEPGSAAAPTAGLHLTDDLLQRCRVRGVAEQRVTLHVGLGTFRPVSTNDVRNHQMHAEWCRLSPAVAHQLQQARTSGNRVIAVGTTSLRTLESAVAANGWQGWEGESRLFIYPPYSFLAVDGLLTNFHLPKSSLLMLVAAFMGYDLMKRVYAEAIAESYRFFSYGDAMLIL